MENSGLDEAQAGIKIAGRGINNLRYADNTTVMAESKEYLKSLLMKEVKEESEKAGLKLNIQKTKIMVFGPISSWQKMGKSGNSDRFYFLMLQNNCGRWLQPWNWKTLATWKKSYDKLRQLIKKQRHHFANKDPSTQSYDFPLVMYRCEGWAIGNGKHRRTDAFKLWC